jgi:hypothetical protein
MDPSLAS